MPSNISLKPVQVEVQGLCKLGKSKGLSKKHFIYKHNNLVQLIVKFWIEQSTLSPDKKDVVHKHSERPGDHSRVKPAMDMQTKSNATTNHDAKWIKEGKVLIM